MKPPYFLVSCLLLTAGTASAEPTGWTVVNATDGETLMFDGFADKGVTYKFSCVGQTLTATEIGVTQLMNMADGQKIGDVPGSLMPPGAAVMTLFADRAKPAFIAADATPNAKFGWDLTIRLPLNNPAVRALPKAKSLSLMTTGWTGLVELGQSDRVTISSFLKSCETT
jgi:hypothetical protein